MFSFFRRATYACISLGIMYSGCEISVAAQIDSEIQVESWLTKPAHGVVDSTADKPETFCRSFLQRNAGSGLQCSVVYFPNVAPLVVLDDPFPDAYKPFGAVDATCQDNFAAKINSMHETWLTNRNDQALSKELEQNLRTQAIGADAVLVPMLSDGCLGNRKAAAVLLRFSNICAKRPNNVMLLLLARDVQVRNSVSSCLAPVVNQLNTEDKLRLLDLAFRQLGLPSHADRNKAVTLIHNLAESSTEVRSLIAESYVGQLENLIGRSKAPNVGPIARSIISKLNEANAGGSK